MRNLILIVDPFSTGRFYAPKFQALGFQPVAALSSENVPEHFLHSFQAADFYQQRLFTLAEIKQQFRPEQIKAVVIGSETGVIAGEQLANYFGVQGNDPQTSLCRRDKFAMQQALKQARLPHIPTEIISAKQHDISSLSEQAYIVKPLNSAGSENVFFCANKAELADKIAQIQWGKRNITGEINQFYLVQPFLTGTEFVVDLVVAHGKAEAVSLCRYQKGEHNGSRFVYEHMQMLDPNLPEFNALIHYAKQACTALGFRFEAVHMELMVKGEKMVMIEAGGRLHGGIAPLIFQRCYHDDLLSQSVALHLGLQTQKPATLNKAARVVFLYNSESHKRLNQADFLQKLQTLPSFITAVFPFSAETVLPITVDLLTCPCFIALVADSKSQIEQDEQQLRQDFLQFLQ